MVFIKFTTNVLKVKLKLLVFSFVLLVMQKVQNMESVDIQSDAKQNAKKEQIHPVCLHAIEKYKKVESVNTQNDYKTCKR